MTKTLFQGLNVGRGEATGAVMADYHAVDPAAFNVATAGATSVAVVINIAAMTGSGNTITVTISGVTDEGSGVLYTLATKAITAPANFPAAYEFVIDPRIVVSNTPTTSVLAIQEDLPNLMQVACVGSGTRTTLVYDVTVELRK